MILRAFPSRTSEQIDTCKERLLCASTSRRCMEQLASMLLDNNGFELPRQRKLILRASLFLPFSNQKARACCSLVLA